MRRALLAACLAVLACSRNAPHAAPLTLQDDWHRTVALAAPARRIVSLAPATSEIVFALGLGDRLVGRTTWCDYPPEVRTVASVGNGIGPDVEAIARLKPDLVVVYPSEANRAAVTQLEGLGIPAAVLKQDAIADFKSTTRFIARAAGVPARADSLLLSFNRRLDAVRQDGAQARGRVVARAGASVFVAVGANPPIAIGMGSFISELVTLAGGRNAFADIAGPSAQVSLEAVVAHQPDVVMVLGADSSVREIESRPGFGAIAAVRAHRVIALDGSQFDRPSPRLPEAVAALAAKLAAMEHQR
ncbi:MAG TPA: cobalamin-binding protein [Gemmatimonadales bacterium]|jgi:ABC-type Fe3+-hydroxamate transport system substrate-binding protein